MARKIARKKTRAAAPSPTPRHFWLAGLGLVVLAKRQTVNTASQTFERVAQTRRQAIAVANQAQSRLIETAGELRGRVQAGAAQLGDTLDNALAPLVARFRPGAAKRGARRGRKPVAKSRRRAVKKTPAKRARKA